MNNPKTLLDKVLEYYEKQDPEVCKEPEPLKESDLKLWNYLCGDGDIRHLYEYYDLLEDEK